MCYHLLKSLVAALAVAGVAQAHAGQSVASQVTVSYADLDLSNERDANELLRRLDRAASEVCGGKTRYSVLYWQTRARYQACVRQAKGQAVAGVDHPLVNELYAKRQTRHDRNLASR